MSNEKKAVVHEEELAAFKDSRKRDLLLFEVVKNEDYVMWVVAVSEHQAKLALVERVYPMEKCSKKDRDYRLLHLLESAVDKAGV